MCIPIPCSSKICMLCTCIILVVIAIGLLFGFGVFKHGFHNIKHKFDVSEPFGGNPYHYRPPFFNHSASPPY